MPIISPASLFPNSPPMQAQMPSMWQGQMQQNQADAAMQQLEAAKAQQAQEQQARAMELQRSQLNMPVEAMQRQATMGQLGGQIERQPFANSAALQEAQNQANPDYQKSKFAVMLRENQDKLKDSDLKRFQEEMGHAVSAFGPMMDAFRIGDLTGVRDEYKNGLDYLKNAGVDISKFKDTPGAVDPQGNGIAKAKSLYQQAVMNAPTVRKILETRTAHENELEKIRLQNASHEKIAETRAAAVADKPVTSPKAVVAKVMDKYTKDPSSLSPEESGILRDDLEKNYAVYNHDGNDQLWTSAEKAVREEEKKSGTTVGHGTKVRDKYYSLLRSEIKKNYPTLYGKQERTILPSGPRTVDQILDQYK